MSLHELVVLLTGEGNEAELARYAGALARAQGAHLEAFHVRPDPRDALAYVGPSMSAGMIEQIVAAAETNIGRRRAAAHAVFEAECGDLPIVTDPPPPAVTPAATPATSPAAANLGATRAGKASAAWVEAEGRLGPNLARRARLTELVVAARPGGSVESTNETALEAVLFDAGRALLLVPPAWSNGAIARIAVGWDGSTQAAHAVQAATPLFDGADEVEVITIGEAGEPADPDEMARALAWRGVRARARLRPKSDGDPALDLLEEASDQRCDLLVMGAYGHSRLRELVLGGATRTVMHAAAIPVLLCH